MVTLSVTPRDGFREAFVRIGFSDAAADSYARMTALSVDLAFDPQDDAWRGPTSLASYIGALVDRSA